MKILALGDPHGKLPKNLDLIIKKNKIDIIICLGEAAPVPIIPKKGETFKHAEIICTRTFKEVVDKLCSYKLPFLILRGNGYTTSKEGNEITHRIFSHNKNLFYKKTGKLKIKGINFISFDMIYEKHALRTPKKFNQKNLLSNRVREKRLNQLLKENPNSILINHNPPYGYLDKIHSGKHIGSKILLKAIKKHQPKLVLCGHIHEARGKTKIGKTPIYNLGSKGDYAIINTDKNKIAKSNFLK